MTEVELIEWAQRWKTLGWGPSNTSRNGAESIPRDLLMADAVMALYEDRERLKKLVSDQNQECTHSLEQRLGL